MRITKKVAKAGCITFAVGLGLAVGCGDDDDDKKSGTASQELSVVAGEVDQFTADGAPVYGLAVTRGDFDADAADDSDVSFSIGAAEGKTALTQWHTVVISQDPANCASDSDIEAAWADGAWSFTVQKSKVVAIAEACSLTVAANMGEAVPSAWVSTLLNEGQPNGFFEADGTTPAMTRACSGCHGDGGSGNFAMKADDGSGTAVFNLATVVNNLESDDDSDSVVGISYGAASLVDTSCTPTEVATKRIAAGDPNNSAVVWYTGNVATADGVTTSSKADGTVAMRCTGDSGSETYELIVMPKGKAAPVENTDGSTAWPADIHAKFARWVLQGARTDVE